MSGVSALASALAKDMLPDHEVLGTAVLNGAQRAIDAGWVPPVRVGELEDTLLVIANGRMCFKVVETAPPSSWCRNRFDMSRQAEYEAERWCDACIAHDALGTPLPDQWETIARDAWDALLDDEHENRIDHSWQPEVHPAQRRLLDYFRDALTADEAEAIAGRIEGEP